MKRIVILFILLVVSTIAFSQKDTCLLVCIKKYNRINCHVVEYKLDTTLYGIKIEPDFVYYESESGNLYIEKKLKHITRRGKIATRRIKKHE